MTVQKSCKPLSVTCGDRIPPAKILGIFATSLFKGGKGLPYFFTLLHYPSQIQKSKSVKKNFDHYTSIMLGILKTSGLMAPLQRGLSRAYFTYDRDWGIGLCTTCAIAQLAIFSTFRMMKTSFLTRNKCTKLGF